MDAAANLLFKPLYKEVARIAPTPQEREALIDYMFAKANIDKTPFDLHIVKGCNT